MSRALYVCYFGVRQPLVQTQVIPYLRELVKDGHALSLLTFELSEKHAGPGDRSDADIDKVLREQGIKWYSLRYHSRFSVLATLYDVVRAALFVAWMISRKKLDILHGRSHVATLIGALARKLSARKPRLLFDIRGFFPDEYTDAGIWPEGGWLYRSVKRVERWLLDEADGFVVLTEKAREILFPDARATGENPADRPIEVIPCCVDLSRFATTSRAARDELRKEIGVEGRFVAAYVGAFGGWYLTEETADFFGTLRKDYSNAFAMVLTQSDPDLIRSLLEERGYGPRDILITRVAPPEISKYLSGADVAISFIKNCYSKQASSPTKNAEYLACGLPIIANAGIGDVDSLLIEHKVGVLVEEFSVEGYRKAIQEIAGLGDVADRCRETARQQFDLETVGGERYRRLYRRLTSDQPAVSETLDKLLKASSIKDK